MRSPIVAARNAFLCVLFLMVALRGGPASGDDFVMYYRLVAGLLSATFAGFVVHDVMLGLREIAKKGGGK